MRVQLQSVALLVAVFNTAPVAFANAPIECDECDAGQACGMCLMIVPETECPSGADWRADPNLKDGCTSEMVIGNLCEADGHCGTSDDFLTEFEAAGVEVCPFGEIGNPDKCAPNQHPQYPIWPGVGGAPGDEYVKDEGDRRTMSCALCGRLLRTFPTGPPIGAPAKIKAAVGVDYSLAGVPEDKRHLYTANWDLHPFGVRTACTTITAALRACTSLQHCATPHR